MDLQPKVKFRAQKESRKHGDHRKHSGRGGGAPEFKKSKPEQGFDDRFYLKDGRTKDLQFNGTCPKNKRAYIVIVKSEALLSATNSKVGSEPKQPKSKNSHHDLSGNPLIPFSLSQSLHESESEGDDEEEPGLLLWPSEISFTPLEMEEKLLPVLLRWRNNERGMMRNQPDFRLPLVEKACRGGSFEIPLRQALSLRRHHMRRYNPFKSNEALGLGSEDDTRESAELFERSVEEYLISQNISFLNETEIRKRNALKSPNRRLPTPDFLLQNPVVVTGHNYIQLKYQKNKDKLNQHQNKENSQTIRWIEVKHFYGASTIVHDGKSAVGQILKKARNYTEEYGKGGAFVFAYGCGEILATELALMGVLALDCGPVCMAGVDEHLKTYCADSHGRILP